VTYSQRASGYPECASAQVCFWVMAEVTVYMDWEHYTLLVLFLTT